MASTVDYAEFVCEQIRGIGEVRYRKMFGEYQVYVNNKPILLICDNTPFVKQLECIAKLMKDAEKGLPYKGAKEHYILDIEDTKLCHEVLQVLEEVVPLPKPKKKKLKETLL